MSIDLRILLWNTAALLFAYMAVAMPLPAISGVTLNLGFSKSLGGFAVGISFIAILFSRGYAGKLAYSFGNAYRMVFTSMDVESIRRVSPDLRGALC